MGNSINKVERAVHGALDYGELVRLVRKDKAPVRLIDYEHRACSLAGFCYKLDVMSV